MKKIILLLTLIYNFSFSAATMRVVPGSNETLFTIGTGTTCIQRGAFKQAQPTYDCPSCPNPYYMYFTTYITIGHLSGTTFIKNDYYFTQVDDSVCSDFVPAPTCTENEELIDGQCVPLCNAQQILIDGVCENFGEQGSCSENYVRIASSDEALNGSCQLELTSHNTQIEGQVYYGFRDGSSMFCSTLKGYCFTFGKDGEVLPNRPMPPSYEIPPTFEERNVEHFFGKILQVAGLTIYSAGTNDVLQFLGIPTPADIPAMGTGLKMLQASQALIIPEDEKAYITDNSQIVDENGIERLNIQILTAPRVQSEQQLTDNPSDGLIDGSYDKKIVQMMYEAEKNSWGGAGELGRFAFTRTQYEQFKHAITVQNDNLKVIKDNDDGTLDVLEVPLQNLKNSIETDNSTDLTTKPTNNVEFTTKTITKPQLQNDGSSTITEKDKTVNVYNPSNNSLVSTPSDGNTTKVTAPPMAGVSPIGTTTPTGSTTPSADIDFKPITSRLDTLSNQITATNNKLDIANNELKGIDGSLKIMNNSVAKTVDNPLSNSISIIDGFLENFNQTVNNLNSDLADFQTKVSEAQTAIDGGFDNFFSRGQVTSCSYSNELDFSTVGYKKINIDIDICQFTSLTYPLFYPLFLMIFTASFIYLAFSILFKLVV